ncbi:MAG: alpha/beta fold hydrolase, partial [Hyphomonadaceae bacterium]
MNRAKNRKALAAFALMVLLAACANPDTAATQAPPPETASAGSTAPDVAESERFPTSENYPPGTMERWSFDGGAPAHWRLSALRTPGREAAPWRIVVITGTPSWSEYWAPAIAKAPANREMIVADRPGFSRSEPESAVTDIAAQARALSPLL